MTFILDHLGHNSGGDDFETWAPAIADLARRCPNVYAKLGAIEQWDTREPGRRFNRKTFGLSFGLKNGLRFHFDSETCLNSLFLNTFSVYGISRKNSSDFSS